jgi:hypothetical protein
MAVGFDPQRPYDLWLDCFEDVSKENRPCLVYRRITGREYGEMAKARELEGKSLNAEADAIYEALRIGLIGWKNQFNPETKEPIEFDPAKLPDVVDPVEANELLNKRLYGARLNGKELKN